MKISIIEAAMERNEENGYVGHVRFEADGHKKPYEITLQSKNAKQWSYSLNFSGESGPEEEIFKVEEALEEDDELFDYLVDAAKSAGSL
jgi:hypothetical protein